MIPEGWKPYKLGDFIDINPSVHLKKDEKFSFIEMKDLDSTRKYVTPSCKKKLAGGAKFCNGDTLFARITPCLENGKICQARNIENNCGFGSTEFIVLRGKKEISISDFVYYLSRSNYIRNAAIQNMTGTSGRQRVETSAFAEIDFIAPLNLTVQSRIASILSSLDDKIELNLRMNKTLEAIAQAIFKEWFVDFRFPGFDGELVDGLPKGWRKGTIKEIYKTTSGGTPSRSNDAFFIDGSIKWVKSKELNGSFIIDTEEQITEDALNNSSAKTLPKNSLLIAMYGATVGEFGILSTEASCNQAICAIIPNERYPFTYILGYYRLFRNRFINQASGSAQQNISQALIQNNEVIIPKTEIAIRYHEIVSELYAKTENNLYQNLYLQKIRDLLLPKLMTGKIKVW